MKTGGKTMKDLEKRSYICEVTDYEMVSMSRVWAETIHDTP